jgi:hypothetical protein
MTSDVITVAIITSVPPTLMALASLVASIRNGRTLLAARDSVNKTVGGVSRQVDVVTSNLSDVHDAVNGKAQEMIDTVKAASFAEGVKKGETQRIDVPKQ